MTLEQEKELDYLKQEAYTKKQLFELKNLELESKMVEIIKKRLSGKLSKSVDIIVDLNDYSWDININNNGFCFYYEKEFNEYNNYIKIKGYHLRLNQFHQVCSNLKNVTNISDVDFMYVYMEFVLALKDRNDLFDFLVSSNNELLHYQHEHCKAITLFTNKKESIDNELKLKIKQQLISNFNVNDQYVLHKKNTYYHNHVSTVVIESVHKKTLRLIFNGSFLSKRFDKEVFAEMIMLESDPRIRKMVESTEDASFYKKNNI